MPRPTKSRPTGVKAQNQPTAKKTIRRSRRKKGVRGSAASPNTGTAVRPGTKLASLITLLSRNQGATLADLEKATDWQAHSVRGAISGTLKKKLGFAIISERVEGQGRVYRIAEPSRS